MSRWGLEHRSKGVSKTNTLIVVRVTCGIGLRVPRSFLPVRPRVTRGVYPPKEFLCPAQA